MRRVLIIALEVVLLSVVRLSAQVLAAESAWIATLHSAAARPAKEAACRSLKRYGSAAAVPALAALLADAELGMDARDALESMPCPEAGQALLAALDTTTGRVKAGIIGSLAVRREVAAGHRLLPLLQSADPGLGTAAALALGSLGDGVACEALGRALATCPPGLRPACAEGLLRCAEQLRDGGDRVGADALCSMLSLAGQGAPIRAAAWTALLLPGDQTVTRLAVALDGGDWVAAQAAVQAAATLEDPAVTRVVAERLGRPAPAPLRVGLLESLARRGDPAATAAVVVACGDADERVRVAALKALAELGDASQVAFLANHAAQAAGAEQAAARDALYRLHRGEVTASLLKLLTEGPAGLRMEVMAALSRRGDAAACDTLLGVATGPDEKAAVSACEALAELAGLAQIERLVQCLVQAQTKAVREAAGKALVNAGRRSGRLDEATAAVLRSVSVAPSEAKAALLRAAGELGGAGALEHLREALADADPGVRTAAVRTLADFTGPEAIPELLGLAKASQESSHRVLALRGYWRLVALSGKRTAEERLGLCRDGLAACERPEEKRLGLGELARIPLAGALELALAAEADEAVRAEAQLALVQICRQTMAADRATAGPLLQRLSTDGAAEQVRTEAGRAMEALHRLASYIMPWLASGPYRQEGKECQQLFAVAFPPEADIDNAEWRPASVPADPALAYQVDLASVVAGNHAVAYIRTRVFAPREQPVALALGVDDGVKLWINGQLVHENNAVRGLNPDEDKAQATLRQGWNDLLAKVTQHTAGCGLCLRLTAPDGALVEGLRVDPAGK